MAEQKKKYTVKLNNLDKIEQLLQETYELASQQYTLIQAEMNSLTNTTVLKDLDIAGKAEYSKCMTNYMKLQQQSVTQKLDIAKLMGEVMKQHGDVKKAIEAKKNDTTLDYGALKRLAKEANTSNNKEEYHLNR